MSHAAVSAKTACPLALGSKDGNLKRVNSPLRLAVFGRKSAISPSL